MGRERDECVSVCVCVCVCVCVSVYTSVYSSIREFISLLLTSFCLLFEHHQHTSSYPQLSPPYSVRDAEKAYMMAEERRREVADCSDFLSLGPEFATDAAKNGYS